MSMVGLFLLLCLAKIQASVGVPTQALKEIQDISSLALGYSAQQVIKELGLVPNVEGGYFRETFRDTAVTGNRPLSTAIYYLLEASAGESLWHRVDASEVWHYYAGAPLSLYISQNDGLPMREEVLGPDILRGQRPQVVISTNEWQKAKSHGEWTLVGTTGM